MLSWVPAPCIVLVASFGRQQNSPMQLHMKRIAIASLLANVPLSLPLLTVQPRFQERKFKDKRHVLLQIPLSAHHKLTQTTQPHHRGLWRLTRQVI